MQKTLIEEAISAALKGNWSTAVELNERVLESRPNDIPTLNRLAKAYLEIGALEKAKAAYEQVLSLDKFNTIAKKNVKLLNHYAGSVASPPPIIDLDFIEEPGKTKTLPLTRLGDPKILCHLLPGQVVRLIPKNHTICVFTDENDHIGALTDDNAYHFKKFLEAGYQYRTIIKSASPQKVTVFVRQKSSTPVAN